jgi:hypothetical protein
MKILRHLLLKPKEWRAVYIELVSAGIIALFGLLSLIKVSWLRAFSDVAGVRVSIPAWSLGFSLLAVLFWLFSVLRRLRIPAHIRKYHEDEFDGILWRWNYTDGKISELTPFCAKSHCGTELHLFEVRRSDGGNYPVDRTFTVSSRQLHPPKAKSNNLPPEMSIFHGTVIYCTSCNKSFGIKNAFDLPDHVRRKIEKKIRDKEWEQRANVASYEGSDVKR